MQQHYEVINLHNIIKTQEAKIHELKEELRVANEREESRYSQFIQSSQVRIDEKQRMIDYLKAELDKEKTTRTEDLGLQRSCFDRDQEQLEKQVILYKRKCIELEGKFKRLQNDADGQIRQLKDNNALLSEQIYRLKQNQSSVTMQITKLNHFYKNSIFEIGKRRETLLWVEKFTEYLENCESKEQRVLADINSFVTGELEGLKTQIANLVNEVTKCECEIADRKAKNQKEIMMMLSQVQEECRGLMQENENYWNGIIKEERDSEKNQEIKQLRKQLKDNQQESENQLRDLKKESKNYESEKKTLILGFQQLRSLNEDREKNYREEIKHLKKTIEDLIEAGEQRDRDFVNQIGNLSSQIEQISERYSGRKESIQATARSRARQQLISIQSDPAFRSTFDRVKTLIKAHQQKVNAGESEHGINFEIENYIMHCNSILETLMSVFAENKHKDNLGEHSDFQESEIVQEMRQLEIRQKYNKSIYDAALAKKHLAKMQQYYAEMQKRVCAGNTNRQAETEHQLIYLSAENQALKENIEEIKSSYRQELLSLEQKVQLRGTEVHRTASFNQILENTLIRLNQSNDIMTKYLKDQEKNSNQIKDSVESLFRLLAKVDSLANQAKGDSIFNELKHDETHSEAFRKNIPLNNNRTLHYVSSGDIKKYKQILLKKSENTSAFQRLLTQLIKTLKENQALSPKNIHSNPHKSVHDDENHVQLALKVEHSKASRLKGTEKKYKELQQERVRERQDFITKLQKLEESMRHMSSKQTKASSLKSTLNKFEATLQIKINDMLKKMNLKLDRSQVNHIKEEVILDLRSKLQEVNVQNEGLRKEMSLMYGKRSN